MAAPVFLLKPTSAGSAPSPSTGPATATKSREEAVEDGAPPHGGIASGVDRVGMLLSDEDNIREVIPFPKTASGIDPMTNAPDVVDDKQLDELHVRVVIPPKE